MVHISFESIWLTRVSQDDFTGETPAGETLPNSLHPPEGFYIILLSLPEVGGEERKYLHLLTLVTTNTYIGVAILESVGLPFSFCNSVFSISQFSHSPF